MLTTGPNFSDPPGKGAKAALFRRIIERVETDTALQRPNTDGLSQEESDFLIFKGTSNCNVRFPIPGKRISFKSDPVDYVFLEMGFRGSANPTETVALNSFVGEMILSGKAGDVGKLHEYENDFCPFDFALLHPTRTFVEKLLALHGSFSKRIEDVRTRHYYDVFALYTRRDDIRAFVGTEDFRGLLAEAIEIGNANFNTNLDPGLDISASPVLNLTAEQIKILERQYLSEERYYFKGQPAFGKIVRTVNELRDRLKKGGR